MNIELHIEELVLEGLPIPPEDRAGLRRAVEQELLRLLGTGGPAAEIAAGGMRTKLKAPSLRLQNNEPAAALGRRIAACLHASIWSSTGNSGPGQVPRHGGTRT